VLCQGPKITVKDLALAERPSTTLVGPYNPNDSMIGIPAAPLPPQPDANNIALPADLELEEVERRYAKAVLDRNDGNQSAAARALGISRNKLARLLK
jgi:DNA-binding NtrC family response regulator